MSAASDELARQEAQRRDEQRALRRAELAESERRGNVAAKAVKGLTFHDARPLLDKWLLDPNSRALGPDAWNKMVAAWLVEHRPSLPGLSPVEVEGAAG